LAICHGFGVPDLWEGDGLLHLTKVAAAAKEQDHITQEYKARLRNENKEQIQEPKIHIKQPHTLSHF